MKTKTMITINKSEMLKDIVKESRNLRREIALIELKAESISKIIKNLEKILDLYGFREKESEVNNGN